MKRDTEAAILSIDGVLASDAHFDSANDAHTDSTNDEVTDTTNDEKTGFKEVVQTFVDANEAAFTGLVRPDRVSAERSHLTHCRDALLQQLQVWLPRTPLAGKVEQCWQSSARLEPASHARSQNNGLEQFSFNGCTQNDLRPGHELKFDRRLGLLRYEKKEGPSLAASESVDDMNEKDATQVKDFCSAASDTKFTDWTACNKICASPAHKQFYSFCWHSTNPLLSPVTSQSWHFLCSLGSC
eukprot:5969992-Pleurochrysis_carterae.AAC.2